MGRFEAWKSKTRPRPTWRAVSFDDGARGCSFASREVKFLAWGARSTVRVGLVGKAKTATQMLALVALLVAPPPGASATAPGLRPAGLALLYASVVLSVVSARSYFAAAWPTLRGHDEAA